MISSEIFRSFPTIIIFNPFLYLDITNCGFQFFYFFIVNPKTKHQKCHPIIAIKVINNKLNIPIGNKYFHSRFSN